MNARWGDASVLDGRPPPVARDDHGIMPAGRR